MEERKCRQMVIHLSQRSSSMLCCCFVVFFVCFFSHFFALFRLLKYDFRVDAERMIVKKREM